jgi:hypothetical protein
MPDNANCQNGGATETAITTAITTILFLPFLKIVARAGSTSSFSSMLMTCAKAASMKSIPASARRRRGPRHLRVCAVEETDLIITFYLSAYQDETLPAA